MADCREKQKTEVVNASRLSGEAGLQNCFQCVLLSCFIGKKGISSNDLVVKASITFTFTVLMCYWVPECEFYNPNFAGKEMSSSTEPTKQIPTMSNPAQEYLSNFSILGILNS